MKPVSLFVVLCLFAISAKAQQKAGSGSLTHLEKFHSEFVQPRNVDIWLPDNYSANEKYAVLYMHDAQMLFDAETTWNKQAWEMDEAATKVMASGSRKFIVVGISNIGESRMSDYFPQRPFESLPKKTRDSILDIGKPGQKLFSFPIDSDNYLKFIVTELKPYIDKNFSVASDRKNTFIGGSSMGGLISLYAVCEYPNVFGGALCLSTHWTGVFGTANNPVPKAFLTYLQNKLPKPPGHRFYFDHGTETLDADYGPIQLQVDLIGKRKGFDENKWISKVFPGDDHSEKSWRGRLPGALEFLFKEPL
jgi:enterochelin esterase-like enzyme